MANRYIQGQIVRLTATITVGGVATDPTDVQLEVQSPAGVTSTYLYSLAEVSKSAVGVYYYDLTIAATGFYSYKWEASGSVVGATETYLIGNPTEF